MVVAGYAVSFFEMKKWKLSVEYFVFSRIS